MLPNDMKGKKNGCTNQLCGIIHIKLNNFRAKGKK